MAAYNFTLKLVPLSNDFSEEAQPALVLDTRTDETREVMLGRSIVTGINDKRCSRQHTEVKIDNKSNELVINQLGPNASCVIYNGSTFTQTKHDIKRLPIGNVSDGSQICKLYLIQKDMLYGYHVVLKSKVIKSDASDESVGGATKFSDTKKRSSPTLDSFIIKKAKTESASNSGSTNSASKGEWIDVAHLVYAFSSEEVEPSSKIVGFDMDGTLITTSSGAKWPKNKDDWKFLYPSVPSKLKSLHAEGFKLIIFTNQAGIVTGTTKPQDIKHKIEAIIGKIGVPMQAMIAGCKRGMYRKPLPGMWNEAINSKYNSGCQVKPGDCIYVGDASGRAANWQPGKKKDFSCSDRLFALNCGVQFATPEAFFNGEKEAAYSLPEFSPSAALQNTKLLEPTAAQLYANSQEIIIVVGFPGSGKSYFSTKHLSKYQRVNRDILGSWQKCVARCEQELKQGKSVVIDNTNPDRETRARYLDVAKKYKVKARCFHMSTTYKNSRHNEVYRQLTDSKHKAINEMVVNAYKSKYTEPDLSEGFSEIVRVNIVPSFENDEQRDLYSLYLLEK